MLSMKYDDKDIDGVKRRGTIRLRPQSLHLKFVVGLLWPMPCCVEQKGH